VPAEYYVYDRLIGSDAIINVKLGKLH
jgi:hypothetical protein